MILLPEYKYVVADAKGKKTQGKIKADNIENCKAIFEQRGLFCLKIAPVSIFDKDIGGAKFDLKSIYVVTRQFSAMLNSGISIIKILDILFHQNEDKNQKKVLKSVYESVQKGTPLSKALADQNGAFPEMMTNMIDAGEASGSLDQVMSKISEHYAKSMKTGNKVKSAMMYPMILAIITLLVCAALLLFVVPTFTQMFTQSGTELPLPTKLLLAVSDSLQSYWFVYLAVIIGAFIGFKLFTGNPKGRLLWDKFKTKMPIVGKLTVTILSGSFARTLSTMLSSGISLVKSLEITAKTMNNKYYEQYVNEVMSEIKKGNSLSESLKRRENMFPQMLVSMISIGEESGTMDTVLEKTATFYDEESDSAVTKLVGLLEPLMIVIMALVVGFVVIAIAVPMMTMSSTLQ